jgi:hypothetical protein
MHNLRLARRRNRYISVNQGSTSFLKKRSKKLLLIKASWRESPGLETQKYFGSFLQKRTFFLFSFQTLRLPSERLTWRSMRLTPQKGHCRHAN